MEGDTGGELGGKYKLSACTRLETVEMPPADLRREVARRLSQRLNERLMAGASADPVKLSQPGYRPRYYQQRFGATEGVGLHHFLGLQVAEVPFLESKGVRDCILEGVIPTVNQGFVSLAFYPNASFELKD